MTTPDMSLPCGCFLDRPHVLDVGRGVLARQRVQAHIFGRMIEPRVPWMDEFQDQPHGHTVRFSVWYLPKNMLGIVEDILIETLHPSKNTSNTSGGFSRPDLWELRGPDVVGDVLQVTVSNTAQERKYVMRSPLKNRPGVYAFHVDPGLDELEWMGAFGGMKITRDSYLGSPRLDAIRLRAKSRRTTLKLLQSKGERRPLVVEEASQSALDDDLKLNPAASA